MIHHTHIVPTILINYIINSLDKTISLEYLQTQSLQELDFKISLKIKSAWIKAHSSRSVFQIHVLHFTLLRALWCWQFVQYRGNNSCYFSHCSISWNTMMDSVILNRTPLFYSYYYYYYYNNNNYYYICSQLSSCNSINYNRIFWYWPSFTENQPF